MGTGAIEGSSWAGDASVATLEERFRRKDDRALWEVHRRFRGVMFATAYRLLGDRESASDAVQQAFLQVWRSADRFDTTRSMAPWLCTVTRRAAIDIHRRECRHAGQLPWDDAHAGLPGSDLPTEQLWRIWQVRRAMRQLPDDERTVLVLSYFLDLTQSEVGRRLGIPLGTVKSRTRRAQRHLLELLRHLAPEQTPEQMPEQAPEQEPAENVA